MAPERLPKRRRRNKCNSGEERKPCEKCNGITERMRLERKKAMYDKQEVALRKMQKVVTDQMVKLEVEGLQIAANIREKEIQEFGIRNDETKIFEKGNNAPLSHETINIDNADEVNKFKLDLDTCVEEMLYNPYCQTVEEDDEEDELNFNYLQEFKPWVS